MALSFGSVIFIYYLCIQLLNQISMNNKLTFTVTLEFESKITDDNDVRQVAENIARAIVSETNGEGIAPQDGDTYLQNVAVKPMYLDEVITKKAY